MKKALFFAAFSLFFTAFSQAQTAEDLIAKHIAATGGDKLAKVGSMKNEASITADGAPGMSINMSMTVLRDKAIRMDVSVMGMTQSSAISGEKGWSTNPFQGKTDPEPMTADQVKSMHEMTDVDGALIGYKEKGYTVEYVGTEDVDGTEAQKIKINKGGKKIEYCFLDPSTAYEIKNIQVEEIDGKEVESATVYSNFKTQDGIVFPFTMQQANPMMGNSTITITNITLNPAVDEKIFEMPAKK